MATGHISENYASLVFRQAISLWLQYVSFCIWSNSFLSFRFIVAKRVIELHWISGLWKIVPSLVILSWWPKFRKPFVKMRTFFKAILWDYSIFQLIKSINYIHSWTANRPNVFKYWPIYSEHLVNLRRRTKMWQYVQY